MANLNSEQRVDEYEQQAERHRRQFIERMEQKLRFKESMYRTHHRHTKMFLG